MLTAMLVALFLDTFKSVKLSAMEAPPKYVKTSTQIICKISLRQFWRRLGGRRACVRVVLRDAGPVRDLCYVSFMMFHLAHITSYGLARGSYFKQIAFPASIPIPPYPAS